MYQRKSRMFAKQKVESKQRKCRRSMHREAKGGGAWRGNLPKGGLLRAASRGTKARSFGLGPKSGDVGGIPRATSGRTGTGR